MSKLGKRYKCEICGSEVLCTKAGEGTFICCEQEMKVQEPRPLPSWVPQIPPFYPATGLPGWLRTTPAW